MRKTLARIIAMLSSLGAIGCLGVLSVANDQAAMARVIWLPTAAFVIATVLAWRIGK